MAYRAAHDAGGLVVAIGMDEGQSGAYQGTGTWCNFTFDVIPVLEQSCYDFMQQQQTLKSGLRVVNGALALRTLQEIQDAYANGTK